MIDNNDEFLENDIVREELVNNVNSFFEYCKDHGNKILEMVNNTTKNDEISFNEVMHSRVEFANSLMRLSENPDISQEERKDYLDRIERVENELTDMHFKQSEQRSQLLKIGLQCLSVLAAPLVYAVSSKILNKKIDPKIVMKSITNKNQS